jgi:general secretion pathway protein G
MINRLAAKKREEEGFTLIELLIVIIILGILAAVVVFGVSAFRDDSVKNACKTDAKSVEVAAQAWLAKNGTGTPTMTTLTGTPQYLKTAPNTVKTTAGADYWIDVTDIFNPEGKITNTDTAC